MHLSVQLIGTPQFQLEHVPVTASRRAVVGLLAYLAFTNMEHPEVRYSRESLAALLWTDYDHAKSLANLRHTLWEVAQFIGDGWVIPEHETIYLNPRAEIELDVADFRSLLRQATQQWDPALRIPLLVKASQLYREDFLSGFGLREGPNFNEWVMAQSEKLRHEFATALDTIVADYIALRQPQPAIPYAQRILALNPIHEASQRKLMELYALTDQPAAAIQQYQALEKLLRKELNVDPQSETRELYKKIRRGEFKPISMEAKAPRLKRTAPKHNLPVRLTTFIGREKESAEICRLIAKNRLVTLIGAGGIGKTRLAQQAAESLLNDFANGVWFIPLESVTDEDLVPQTLASYLGVAEVPGQTMVETLVNTLHSQSMLLIVDNCEHLLNACAQLVETLLKECPHLRILVTSREVLRLEGEAFYHVQSLAIPREIQSVEAVAKYESVRLFAERAALAVSTFEITRENAWTVVEICDRLDGIPLAIELAAARVDIFKVEEILKQLNRSFDLLVQHTRSVLPRHQTMRTSIDWGWNLLTDSERRFMRQLSVFTGGWTLQAAQAMGLIHGLELTSALLKKSFIVVNQQTERETRYGFHDVICSYAQEKLLEAGEEKIIRDHHLKYFLEIARQFEPALRGVDQQLWLERLFVERDNIRAALGWAARTNVEAGLYFSNRLRSFWENYDSREQARWLLMI